MTTLLVTGPYEDDREKLKHRLVLKQVDSKGTVVFTHLGFPTAEEAAAKKEKLS